MIEKNKVSAKQTESSLIMFEDERFALEKLMAPRLPMETVEEQVDELSDDVTNIMNQQIYDVDFTIKDAIIKNDNNILKKIGDFYLTFIFIKNINA